MNFMTITNLEAKKNERNEQLSKTRCLYCDILEIFLDTEIKYFFCLIVLKLYFVKCNLTKNAFSLFSVPDISLDTGDRVIDNTFLNTFISKKKSHLVLHKNSPSSSNSGRDGSTL